MEMNGVGLERRLEVGVEWSRGCEEELRLRNGVGAGKEGLEREMNRVGARKEGLSMGDEWSKG